MFVCKEGKFYLNGEEYKLYSGAIHYFRVLPEYWEDRLKKLKAMGLNTVETYVAWNVHEKREGEFVFNGRYDLKKFIEIASKLGLYVIVRPGPYICAEWDFGGFPAWLLKYEDIRLRSNEPKYMFYVKRYLEHLFDEIRDLQISRGGNVIAMQVENEYGSYGRDKEYLEALKNIYRDNGIDCLLFTSDGESRTNLSGGSLQNELMVANFGSHPLKKFADLKELQPNMPLVCGEFWCGWFTNYGGSYNAGSSATQVASYLKEFIRMDAGFNFYMFHGGTNFGFSAGANCYGRYTPDITSYDYGAPLTEWGEYTEKYHLSREVLHKAQGLPMEELPPSPVTKVYDNVKLTEVAELKDCIDDFCIKRDSHLIYHMEHYGQNQGYILYSTEFSGNYADTTLTLSEVHDIAYVYVNGELRGRFNRLDVDYYKGGSDTYKIPLKAFNGTIRIDIIVEAMGRVNYGDKLYDRKGVGEVKIADQRIYGWTVRSMEMESAPNISFSSKENAKENISYPAFFRGNFTAKEKGDTFIDLKGFTKGCVFINGFNLGRYWNIGPERTLYIPSPLLKEENEIVIFEQERAYQNEVSFTKNPIYGSYLPSKSNSNKLLKWFKKR